MTSVFIKMIVLKDTLMRWVYTDKGLTQLKGSIADAQDTAKKVKHRVTHPSSPLLTDRQVPLALVNSHILTGYRLPHQPWMYYIRSIFHLHNETFNIWTHLLPMLFLAHEFWESCKQVDFLTDPYSWPVLSAFVTSCILFILSTMAHVFSSKSPFYCRLFFGLDHSSIAMHGIACVLFHSSTSDNAFHYYIQDFHYELAVITAFCIAFCGFFGKYHNFVRSLCTGMMTWICSGLAIDRYYHYVMVEQADPAVCFLLSSGILSIIAGLSYVLHFPECFFPGKFDLYFQSHQFFHIFSSVMCLTNIRGMVIDLQNRRQLMERQPPMSLAAIFLPCLFILVFQPISIWLQHIAEGKQLKAIYLKNYNKERIAKKHGDMPSQKDPLSTTKVKVS